MRELSLHILDLAQNSIGAGAHNVFFGDPLIDYIPKALGARFRRQCEAALSHLLDFLGNVDGEGVYT